MFVKKIKLSHIMFILPEDLIAQYPSNYRDESRLMVLHRKTGNLEHKIFKEVIDYFNEHALFVVNDN